MFQAHRVAEFLGQLQERRRPAGVDRHGSRATRWWFRRCLPTESGPGCRWGSGRRRACSGRRAVKPKSLENLRQDGRQPEPPPAEDDGPLPQVFLVGRQSAGELQADRLRPQQRQRDLGELAAHQRGRAVGQRLLQPIERLRLAPGHFLDHLARSQQVARQSAGQLVRNASPNVLGASSVKSSSRASTG